MCVCREASGCLVRQGAGFCFLKIVLHAFLAFSLCFLCISNLPPLFSVHFRSAPFVFCAFPMGLACLIAPPRPEVINHISNESCSDFFVIFFYGQNRLIAFQCIPMRNGASTYDHFELRPSSGTYYGRKSRHHCIHSQMEAEVHITTHFLGFCDHCLQRN